MKFKVFRRAAFARVTVEGKVESYHMKIVRESVRNLIDQGFHNLIVDLTPADKEMSDRLLSCMTQLFAFARLHEGHCVVIKPNPVFTDFLAKTGMEVFVNIVGSLDRALPCLLSRMRKRYDQAFFKMLLQRQVLTKAQLKETIDLYRGAGENKPFGDILLEKGYLTIESLLDLLAISMKIAPADLENVVSEEAEAPVAESPQQKQAQAEDLLFQGAGDFSSSFEDDGAPEAEEAAVALAAPPAAVQKRPQNLAQSSEFVTKSLFGEILVENGFITEGELRSALDLQRGRAGARLGDILIEQGYIDNQGVFDALQSQVRRRKDTDEDEEEPFPKKAPMPKSEFFKPSLFGEILLEFGLVTEDQLRMALDIQRDSAPGKQLGDILVEMGVVTPQQILQAVEEQANRKG